MEYYKTELPFDQKELQELFAELDNKLEYIYYGRSKKSGLSQGIIPDCDVTRKIMDKIEGALHCSFIKVEAGCDLKAHTDTRGVAINYPIHIPKDSYNIQYDAEAPGTKIRQAYMGRSKESTAQLFLKAEEISRFLLDKVTVLNTHVPHGVIGGDTRRVILSVSMKPEYDNFNDVIKKLQANGY